jgi:predicted RNase H-like HicB family nuclease
MLERAGQQLAREVYAQELRIRIDHFVAGHGRISTARRSNTTFDAGPTRRLLSSSVSTLAVFGTYPTASLARFAHGLAAGEISLVDNGEAMRTYTAVIERDQATGLYVGYVPGWAGAHSQGESLDELRANLHEVMQMLLEDGEPALSAEFVGTQTLDVA